MSQPGEQTVHERRRAEPAGAGGADGGRRHLGESGLNLKPSGRVRVPASLEERTSGPAVGQTSGEDPLFSCRGVNVFYGSKHALKNVTLDVARKQVLAMICPSGCGKSTLLRCLNHSHEAD